MIDRIMNSDRFFWAVTTMAFLAPAAAAIWQQHWSPLLFYVPLLLIFGL